MGAIGNFWGDYRVTGWLWLWLWFGLGLWLWLWHQKNITDLLTFVRCPPTKVAQTITVIMFLEPHINKNTGFYCV